MHGKRSLPLPVASYCPRLILIDKLCQSQDLRGDLNPNPGSEQGKVDKLELELQFGSRLVIEVGKDKVVNECGLNKMSLDDD